MLDLDAPARLTLAEIAMPSAPAELLMVGNDAGDAIGYMTLRRYPEAWLISDVFTQQGVRRQGLGSELLARAIEVSEESDLDLVLRVAGNGAPDTLDDEQLGHWYRRYGFDTHPEWDNPTVLIRRASV